MKNNIVCLVGGGNIPSFTKEYLQQYPVIAVDGGANMLFEQNIIPQTIVGDLDSINPIIKKKWENKTKFLHISEQDTTDFEKALYSINADMYLCFGFWGEEIDHSLGNFHLLQKYFHKKIILFSEKSCMFALSQNGELSISPGNIFSVYPLSNTKFTASSGLQYPLDNLILEPGKAIGIRNKAISSHVSWSIEYGKSIGIIASHLRNTIISFFIKS